MADLQNRIEAILFASGKGVSEEDLANFCQSTPKTIHKYAKRLQEEYATRDTSLVISQHENKWKLTVRGKYLNDIKQITSETELSNSVLKTLAIIAFKSPVLQSTIIDMRGQGAYEHIKVLAKQKFLTKEDQGRTYVLKITDKFYNYFDIEGDDEIREVFDAMKKQQSRIIQEGIIAAEKEQAKRDSTSPQRQETIIGQIYTRQDAQEDKDKQNAFLEEIDTRLSKTSNRLDQDDITSIKKAEDKPSEENSKLEENKDEESKNTSDEDDSNNTFEKMPKKKSQESQDEKEHDYKKEIEEFANEENSKDQEKEKFI
ncbi:MAG: SMC-Scp complex subunit ScpB [Candidatus Woesearchaeota archaeon]